MAMVVLTNTQVVDVTIPSWGWLDRNATPTVPQGAVQKPVWTVDQPALVSLKPDGQGQHCTVKALGPLGTAVVSVSIADNAGNQLASGSVTVLVQAGGSASIPLTVGRVREQ